MLILKINLNMCMIGRSLWVIHLILIVFSIGITIDIYFVYSYLCIYMYASTSNNINLDWYLHFHIYICVCVCVFWLCLLYLYIFEHKFCHAKLDLVLNDNYFSNWYLIQAYALFSWVFHKGEKIHVSPFNQFCLPLVSYTHSLCWKMIS